MALNRTPYDALIDEDPGPPEVVGSTWNKTQIKDVLLDPIDADAAFTNASNVFAADQTIEGLLTVEPPESTSTPGPESVYTSTFSGAENPLSEGGKWAQIGNGWNPCALNNGAYANNITNCLAVLTVAHSGDQYTEITYDQDPGATSWVGVTTRRQAGSAFCYLAIVHDGKVKFYLVTAGPTFTLLEEVVASVGTAPRRLRLESEGTTHRVSFNDTLLITRTDATYTSIGPVGIAASAFPVITKIKTFDGGNLTGAVVPVAAGIFHGDVTVNGDAYIVGNINPTRAAEQQDKINKLVGPGAGRTLLSSDLTQGMSIRYDDAVASGRITVGNYDTQTYQPLVLEADHISLTTGTYPPGMEEHLRVHPSGGVVVGEGAGLSTDPGMGVVYAVNGLGATPIPGPTIGPLGPGTLLGRDTTGPGLAQAITVGSGLLLTGTTLSAQSNVLAMAAYQYNDTLAEPPGPNQIRFNGGVPYAAVTVVWIRNETVEGADAHHLLMLQPTGARLLVQDRDDSTRWVRFTTTAEPIDKVDYVEFAVTWVADSGASLPLRQMQQVEVAFGSPSQPTTVPSHHTTHEPGGVDAITALDGSVLTTGTVPDVRLSANVPLLNLANTFTQPTTFAALSALSVTATDGSFTNLGTTPLNASQLTSGMVPDARLSPNVQMKPIPAADLPTHASRHAKVGADPVHIQGLDGFPGTPTVFLRGDGSWAAVPLAAHRATHEPGGSDPLTALSAGILTSGTLPDARLSVNVLKVTGGYPGGTTTYLRADGTFAAPGTTPAAHAATHLSGGSDQLFNQNLHTSSSVVFGILQVTPGISTLSALDVYGTAQFREPVTAVKQVTAAVLRADGQILSTLPLPATNVIDMGRWSDGVNDIWAHGPSGAAPLRVTGTPLNLNTGGAGGGPVIASPAFQSAYIGAGIAPVRDVSGASNAVVQAWGFVTCPADGGAFSVNLHWTGIWRHFGNGYGGMVRMSGGQMDFWLTPNNTGGAGAAASPTAYLLLNPAGFSVNTALVVVGGTTLSSTLMQGAPGSFTALQLKANATAWTGLYFSAADNTVWMAFYSSGVGILEFRGPSYSLFINGNLFYPGTDGTHHCGHANYRWLYVNAAYCSCNTGGGFVWDQLGATSGIIRVAAGHIEYRNAASTLHSFYVGGTLIGGFSGAGGYVTTGQWNVPKGTLSAPGYSFVNETGSGLALIGSGTGQVLHLCTAGASRLHIEQLNATFNAPLVATIHVIPKQLNTYWLGHPSFYWYQVHSAAWVTASDMALKTDVGSVPFGLDFITRVEPISFRWKDGPAGEPRRARFGLSAQQLDGLGFPVYQHEGRTHGVDYTELIPVLIKAVQELNAKVDAWKNSN